MHLKLGVHMQDTSLPTEPLSQVRSIAQSLDYLLDEDLQVLAGVKGSTTDAWRKRGKGPDYVFVGNRFLARAHRLEDGAFRTLRPRCRDAGMTSGAPRTRAAESRSWSSAGISRGALPAPRRCSFSCDRRRARGSVTFGQMSGTPGPERVASSNGSAPGKRNVGASGGMSSG